MTYEDTVPLMKKIDLAIEAKKASALSWDETWIKMAHEFSKKSKDPSTKVGCVIIGEGNTLLSIGFNGFPRNVDEVNHPERWDRPAKYVWVEHAERNCCYNAARNGIKLRGATAYLNWDPIPCVECTKALIQSGIASVVGPANRSFKARPNASNTDYNFDTAVTMLNEAGILLRQVEVDPSIFA
jgi:dCMP deaminase